MQNKLNFKIKIQLLISISITSDINLKIMRGINLITKNAI